MTEREIFEKFDNLIEDELNTKSNKKVYVKNDVMTTVIKQCRGEKKEAKKKKKIDGFRKKLMIPESEISECPELKSNQKQEIYLSKKKYSKNILLRFIKLILISMSITEKNTS